MFILARMQIVLLAPVTIHSVFSTGAGVGAGGCEVVVVVVVVVGVGVGGGGLGVVGFSVVVVSGGSVELVCLSPDKK